MALVGLGVATLSAGCTSPQSGSISGHWCARAATFDTLDDMEDGDASLCNDWGTWILSAGASVVNATPTAPDGTLLRTDPTTDPSQSAPAGAFPSTRAIHWLASGFTAGTGTDPNHWAFLRATFAPAGPFPITTYSGLRFHAKSSLLVQMRVNVATSVTRDVAGSDDFGRTVSIDPAGSQIDVAFGTTTQEGFGAVSAPDFANATLLSLDFKLASQYLDDPRDINPDSFDVWIDDVQLLK